MGTQGLRVVTHEQHSAAHAHEQTAVDRVFGHWVYMLHKSPRRTALGPKRRRAIEQMLALYEEETLLLAIEGCAASAWHAGENDRGRAFDDLELILRDEPHVERFAEMGQRLRERLLSQAAEARAAAQVATVAAGDAAELAAARERLREAAARLSGRRYGG